MAIGEYPGALGGSRNGYEGHLEDSKQSSAEQRLVTALDELYEEGKKVRDRHSPENQMEEDLKLYRGEIGPKDRYFDANFIEAFIDRMTAQLTDNRPVLRVEHRKAGLKKMAMVSQQIARAIWDEAEMQRQLYKMCHTSGINGAAGLYTGHAAETDDVVLEMLEKSQVVVDPIVKEAGLIKQAEYLMIDRVKPLSEIRELFPLRGSLVKADASVSERPEESKKRSITGPLTDFLKGKKDNADALPRATLREIFVMDRQKSTGGKRLFPNGRRIIKCNDYILLDQPFGYWDGIWPYDQFDWIVDPKHLWGMSEPHRLKRLQLAFNQIMNGTVENHILTNIMTVLMDPDAIPVEARKKLQSLNGTLVLNKTNRNSTVDIKPPPVFGADKISLARALFTFAQLLTGVTDVTLGENPGSLQSGQAVEGLQEGANLMTRSRASRLEDFMGRVGQKIIARSLQFWPSERVLHLVGPTGSAVEYVFKRTEFFIDDQGEPIGPEERKDVFKYLRFKVQPGTSAPGSKIRRTELAMKLFGAGLETGEGVLETAEYPDASERAAKAAQEASKRDPKLQEKMRQSMGR